ncbi:MAG TPA: CBS domain-containing protein [Actinomycetota bacterium]|nr:CBS domain-containing protein [Actinomycetota bacterium]
MTRVSDVMTSDVISVREDTPLKEIARLMHERRISGVPVVGDEGRLEGIVSEADLLALEEERVEPKRRRSFVEWFIDPSRLAEIEARAEDVRAKEIMTRDVVTVGSDAPIREAIKAMLDAGVKRLPVVDDDGKLVGIASRTDLISPMLREDDEIEREVKEDVILRSLWIDPTMMLVDVEGGVVRLEGRVESRSVKEILVDMVRRVDGVVGVEADDLSYEVDDREIEPPPARTGLTWGENWTRRT